MLLPPSIRAPPGRCGCGLLSVTMVLVSNSADELFTQYGAEAPVVQSGLYRKCWDIVGQAVAATVPDAAVDAGSFDGALEAFVSAGPDDPSLVPEEQRGLIEALSDTAASYTRLVDARRLSWATRYRTLNRPLGAYFCGISLWPRTTVDVPNFTLYFGSGSAVNPDRVFMRLEMVPRVDTDTDAAYAEKYYRPFNERFFQFLEHDGFEPCVAPPGGPPHSPAPLPPLARAAAPRLVAAPGERASAQSLARPPCDHRRATAAGTSRTRRTRAARSRRRGCATSSTALSQTCSSRPTRWPSSRRSGRASSMPRPSCRPSRHARRQRGQIILSGCSPLTHVRGPVAACAGRRHRAPRRDHPARRRRELARQRQPREGLRRGDVRADQGAAGRRRGLIVGKFLSEGVSTLAVVQVSERGKASYDAP